MKKAIIYFVVVVAALLYAGPGVHSLHAAEEEHLHQGAEHEHGHEGADIHYKGKIGDYEVTVMQHGELPAGGGGHFDMALSGAQDPPTALRVWIGVRSAKGSVKSRAGKGHEPGQYHVQVEVPQELPPGSQLWIEIQNSAGRTRGAFDLK